MTTKRFTPLLLQLVLAISGLQTVDYRSFCPRASYCAAAAPVEAAPATDAAATEAAPAVDQAQSAASAAEESTKQHNPYGLDALWSQGDFVAKGTLVLMAYHVRGYLVHVVHQAVGTATSVHSS